MKFFKRILYHLFNTLHRQVVTCHQGGLSLFFLLIYALAYLLYIGRNLAVSVSLYYNITDYFEIDVISREVLYKQANGSKYLTSFFVAFSTLFSSNLFGLLYVTPDRKVWSHLHDIVVRNREQANFQWWQQSTEVNEKPVSQWALFNSGLKISRSSKLLHYPFLKKKFRARCILICYIFEFLTTINLLFNDILPILHVYTTIAGLSLNFSQILYLIVIFSGSILYINITTIMYLFAILIIFLVCHIYSAQYQRVNIKLTKAKVKLMKATYNQKLNSLQLSQVGNAYRSMHCRLTIFILHYNNITVSKIVAYYLHYVMPYHSYCLMLLYFQRNHIPLNLVKIYVIVLVVLLLFLMVITINVAKVNKKICSSGQTLGTIFAKMGVLSAGKRRCSWVNNFESIWSHEALKLSTYYEMIWRTNNELAFTAGQLDTPLNWKFILDVSFCKNICGFKIVTYFLQLAFIYSSFVLYFGGKFINEYRGYN